jgi:Chaperone of endosialidase
MNLRDRGMVAHIIATILIILSLPPEEQNRQNGVYMKTKNLSFIFIAFLAYVSASPSLQAVSPPPDGGYPGGNTAEGQNALLGLTSGGYNTAVGFFSLRTNSSNSFNTALGAGALFANTADENTAIGAAALLSNTSGTLNTATGVLALLSNTTGGDNTATGFKALFSNVSGFDNNAFGYRALESHTANDHNNAFGAAALLSDQNGISNTAIGDGALQLNVSGVNNTAVGDSALLVSTGNENTAVGVQAGGNVTTASNVICIGSPGNNVDNSCYIGNIYGAAIDPATGIIVGIDSTGKLGTMSSSQRFKRDIQPIDRASDAILKFKPVSFHYKNDAKNIPCYGLIAEQVAQVSPELVVRDNDGKPYSVRYDQVNAMLLNEFLKEHQAFVEQQCKVQEQEAIIADLRRDLQANVTRQQKQIEMLTANLQRVSAELEVRQSAPQMVLNAP